MTLRQQLAADLGKKIRGATVGVDFGHGCLMVDNKVFAFTRADESAALKLPATRIAELLIDGEVQHLKMGQRVMREWVVIPNIAAPDNLSLLHEAMAFVATLPKTERRKASKKKTATKTVKSKKAARNR